MTQQLSVLTNNFATQYVSVSVTEELFSLKFLFAQVSKYGCSLFLARAKQRDDVSYLDKNQDGVVDYQ